MVQKKICMVGVFGTGKTALVQQFVHSIFSPRYLSTVGVKIDRKPVTVAGQDVTLLLWDLEGKDDHRDISTSYVRGAHGLIYVADGTRPETFDQLFDIRAKVTAEIGEVPSLIALNKSDLTGEWRLAANADRIAADRGCRSIRTSAKTGEGVETMFQQLADLVVAKGVGS